jgi:AcrR family transcriptional regulator
MKRLMVQRGKVRARAAHHPVPRSLRTRSQLIEAAGQEFAEMGFDGATGKDICRRAGVHSAAIVYHFGGMTGLYREVLEEAQRRLVTTEAIIGAVKAQSDPRRQLEALLRLIVLAVTSPEARTWVGRLFAREFVSPPAISAREHTRVLATRSKLLKSIVSALTGRPPNDPMVARGCISTMAPCAILLLVNRRKLKRLFPQMSLGAESAPEITRHLVEFALAGLDAISTRTSEHSPGLK